jgi:hypothetical protein
MKRVAIAFAFLAICASSVDAGPVRLSQVYSGGGSGTDPVTYKQDYLELFNNSGSAVDISGWLLCYASATGNFGTSLSFTLPANTVIQPCSWLLIGCGTVGAAGADFPVTADVVMSSGPNLSATSGKIALISTGPAGTTTCPAGTVEDFVGFGTANCAEGTAVGVLSKTTGAVRLNGGITDTDNNSADFTVETAPVPRNSQSGMNPGCQAVPTQRSTWGVLKALYN